MQTLTWCLMKSCSWVGVYWLFPAASPWSHPRARSCVLQAFDVVEKSYFETIDDALAEKASLSSYHLQHNEVRTVARTLFY